ncbi:hypothetical protein [Promicromonospora aerolata]|uniref:Uncharacterized protein n=1 Tax=Promicromonospora aerolata TaxID=195749 RepID=A0ABW4VHY7_9MICO
MSPRRNRNAKPPVPVRPASIQRTARQPVHFGVDVEGNDVRWIATSTLYLYAKGSNPMESVGERVMAHAMLRMDFHGVAVFKRSELSRLCAQLDRQTGELKPLSADGLNRAIARLVERGYLLTDSWAQTLYVAVTVAQNGRGQGDARQNPPRKPGFDGGQAPPGAKGLEQ